MQVNLNSTDPYQLVYTGTPGMIVNLSTTNRILLGPTQGAVGILTNPVCTPLGPLNSVHVDGTTDVWAIAFAGTPTVAFFPHMDQWSPSPAQVQAQLQPSILFAVSTALNSTVPLVTVPSASRLWAAVLEISAATLSTFSPASITGVGCRISSAALGTIVQGNAQISGPSQAFAYSIPLELSSPIPIPAGDTLSITGDSFPTGSGVSAIATVAYSTP